MNLEAFFAEVRKVTADLARQFPTGFCYLVSRDKFQAVCEDRIDRAAKAIVSNSHVLASEEQISQHLARGAAFSTRMASQQFNRRKADTNGVTITLSK
jgi:hypothetical protein